MAAVDLPQALTAASWDKHKAALAKEKEAAKLNHGKLSEALKGVTRLHLGFDYDAFDAAGLKTLAAAEDAMKSLEASIKGPMKALRGSAKAAEAAADEFAAAAETLKKTLKGESVKVVTAVTGAASAAAKAASAFERDLAKLAENAKAAIEAAAVKLKAQEKKGPGAASPGGKPVESKASKFVRSKAIECIRKIKKPQPGAKPWRFIVVQGSPSVTICMVPLVPGTAHEKMLKSLIPNEKYKTFKDPKGEIIWEKNAITLVSDRLPLGLAKRMQIWLKKITKLNARIRIRKTTGEVEESEDGEDIADDLVKVDPAEAAEKAKAGKDFTKRLGQLLPDIKKALGSKLPDDVKARLKELVDSINKHGKAQAYEDADSDLDEVEVLLDEDVGSAADDSDDGIDEDVLRKALQGWADSRNAAVSEITALAGAIVKLFASEPAHKAEVAKALVQLGEVGKKLKGTPLDAHIAAALAEKDAAKRTRLAAQARATVESVQKMLVDDKVIANLDHNEVIESMSVVAPMKQRLQAIAAALG